MGWPGEVPAEHRASIEARLIASYGCHPVFLPGRLVRRYYTGFSNRTIWPLFHSFPSYAEYSTREWEAYESANRLFRDRVVKIAGARDLIWIHDYHLMLLPRLIRDRVANARIGFFLHVPFPPYDVLRRLPWHRDVVAGLLAADLIGFHTYDDAQSFLRAVRRLFGLDSELGRISVDRRAVQVDVFPMGVDFDYFARAPTRPEVRDEIARIRRRIGPAKLVFSISRLDYTKGIAQQLHAIGAFLESHPEWRRKIAFLFVVVPSREHVARYAMLKRQIDELVGRINSRFGTLEWTPIRYIYRALSSDELVALYAAADIALITPLRDGMNLIAKEYLAVRTDGRGVLILSEMAGAAKELREALIVNPNSEPEVAEALARALRMAEEEQAQRNRAMRLHLEAHDIRDWGRRFLRRFEEVLQASEAIGARLLQPADERALLGAYRRAARRLLLLDYDGTLVPFTDEPGRASPSPTVMETIEALARVPGTEVVLVSGRRKDDLERWFGWLPVTLVGEHGAWVRPRGARGWEEIVPRDDSWKAQIREVVQSFVERVPGSFIEEKDHSLAWHYRRADVGSGMEAAKELIETLTSLTANLDLQVLPGNKVVEIKSSRASKGQFFATHLRTGWDFILAAGDDRTDESLFAVLPNDAFSIRVGLVPTSARFVVESPTDVLRLLEGLHHPATTPAAGVPAAAREPS